MNRGTSRASRTNKELSPDFIKMDERSLLDMLYSTLLFAKHVKFFNTNDDLKEDGDWVSFFMSDPIFTYANILKTDIEEFKSDDLEIDENTFRIHDLEKKIKDWKTQIARTKIRNSIYHEIKQLEASIQDDSRTSKEDRFKEHRLNQLYAKIINFRENLIKQFQKEVEFVHNHKPHIGLILAFYKLFEYLQNDINLLTKKHLDFYYRDLLKEQQINKEIQAHKLMIACQPKPGYDNLVIEKGTSFNLDLGKGQEAVCRVDSNTQINKAIITDVRSIYLDNIEPFEIRDGSERFYYDVLYETDIFEELNNLKDKIDTRFDDFPKTFGEENNNFCELGFIISSPSLILEKGEQEITIEFSLHKDNTPEGADSEEENTIELFGNEYNEPAVTHEKNEFEKLLQQFKSFYEKRSKGSKQKFKSDNQNTSLSDEDKILGQERLKKILLKQPFNICITHETGWKEIHDIHTSFKNDIISIRLPLVSINDQLIPYDLSLHAGNLQTNWPCIKVTLNNQATYHPYRFLKNFAIENINITAKVSGVRNLKLSNSIGEIDNTIPFTPFGPIPEKGSYFRIQNPLILHKNLNALQLKINWIGLPNVYEGFIKYYDTYKQEISNSSFKSIITQTRNSNSINQSENLFELDKNSYLVNQKVIDIGLDNFEFSDLRNYLNGDLEEDANSIYMLLTEPEMGFGHTIFSQIYAETAMHNSRFFKRTLPLPNQPYTPTIDQVSVTYENVIKENVLLKQDNDSCDLKFFHLYPFGQEMVFPGSIRSPFYLLPQFNSKGNLFLGLENVMPNDIISIGFELISAVSSNTVINPPKIKWKILNNNKWVDFMDNVLDDGTKGFKKSGILKLKIPNTIQVNNTRLESGKLWIKAEYSDIEDLNSRIRGLFTQAVNIESTDILHSTSVERLIRKKNVKISQTSNKKIQSVSNPVHLSTTHNVENDLEYYTRISERLRHKSRGVTNWDIERLVIEKFDRVDKIRVYGRNSYPNELVQGSTTQIVVVPKHFKTDGNVFEQNKFHIDELREIKNFVKKFVSPFTKIEVCNPIFEELKVRCRIQFKDQSKSSSLRILLNQDLVEFLSPNSWDSENDNLFEKSITKSQIYKFISERPYVEKLHKFSVIQLIHVNGKHRIIDTEDNKDSDLSNSTRVRLRTISAYAILTSAPLHHIEIYREQPSYDEIKGIGDIAIGSDFIISKKTDNGNIYIED